MRAALIAAAFGLAGLAYGFGVGRYEWPPAAQLRALRHVLPIPLSMPARSAADRDARLAILQATPGTADIVMLGDSLTERGNWSELMPGRVVWNRGIAGDMSADVLSRLPEVISRRPRLVFLMVGVNDLRHGADLRETARTIRAIATALRAEGAAVVLQGILRVGRMHQPDINDRVAMLNNDLRAIAADLSIPYLDLNAALAPSGTLADEFTRDGLHLSGRAYVIWSEALRPHLP